MNKNQTRSARIHADSETVRKSVKQLIIDPKATPKKFQSVTAEKEKLTNNYFLLKKRETQLSQANKQQIHEQLINCKLLEPLIQENIKRKNNTSKKKIKMPEQILFEDHMTNEFRNPNNELINKDADIENGKKSKPKFGNEKRFSYNKNEYVNEDQYQEDYNCSSKSRNDLCLKNNIHLGKTPIITEISKENGEMTDIHTNDIIYSILSKNESKSKNKMTSYFLKSKNKLQTNSKSKSKIINKRRLDNLTVSDEEKFAASSKRKKAIR